MDRAVTNGAKLLARACLLGMFLSEPTRAQKPIEPEFERDVLPVFKANCTSCHGGATPQAGLDLNSLAGLLKGGKSGLAIIPGSPERSLLVEKIASGNMPL